MKYALIIIIVLFLTVLFTILYLKKCTKKNIVSMPNEKSELPVYKDEQGTNSNPSFTVELLDYKKNQYNISQCSLGEKLYYKKAKNKRIKVYTRKKLYIGEIAIKDYKAFTLIALHPDYFEGLIYSLKKEKIIKKVIINVQAKVEFSKEIYLLNKQYLNTLITLSSLFEKDQIVETNYGPSTIIEITNEYLVVNVPSLGNRQIYDIDSIFNVNK
jgi:hypothetical protein